MSSGQGERSQESGAVKWSMKSYGEQLRTRFSLDRVPMFELMQSLDEAEKYHLEGLKQVQLARQAKAAGDE